MARRTPDSGLTDSRPGALVGDEGQHVRGSAVGEDEI